MESSHYAMPGPGLPPMPVALTADSILDSLPWRIAVLRANGTIIAVNRAWEEFEEAGGSRTRARVGGNYFEQLREADRRGSSHARQALELIRGVAHRERPFDSLSYQAETTAGLRWFALRAAPLANSEDCAVIAHADITDRMLGHLALEDAHRRLKALSHRVLTIQEEERRSLSLELHDDVGQSLAALSIGLHRLADDPDPERAAMVQECIRVIESSLGKVRHLAQRLRPPQLEQLGLSDALNWLVERQRAATGAAIEARFCACGARRPSRAVEIACYRIAQEALNNATRHARATKVTVTLECDGNLLKLTVHDNGVGFDEVAVRTQAMRTGSLGLLGMDERAQLAGGQLKLRSVRGGGTTVRAIFPLGEPQQP